MHWILLSLLAMILFGLELSISKVATNYISPENVALWRTLTATVTIGIYMLTSRRSVTISKFSCYAFIAGVLLGMAFIFMFKAYSVGPVSVIVPIISLNLIIPVTFGTLVLHEQVTPSKVIGIILACIAIFLLSR